MSILRNKNEQVFTRVLSEEEETKMNMQIFSDRLKGRRKSVFLKEQLQYLEEKLKEKEEECDNLNKEQNQTTTEIQELTAAIFEEANKMIQEATLKRMSADKRVVEAEGEIEILKEEVSALKKMLSNSSPMPQSSAALASLTPPSPTTLNRVFTSHRRATSHCIDRASLDGSVDSASSDHSIDVSSIIDRPISVDFDGGRKELFIAWKRRPTLDHSDSFIGDLIRADITPCLEFPNKKLSSAIFKAVFQNQLCVEPLSRLAFDNFCNLCKQATSCHYKVSLHEDQSDVTPISTFARNRVISVCSLVSYLRYITLGIVKSQDDQMYSEILKLLRRMSLARLGLTE